MNSADHSVYYAELRAGVYDDHDHDDDHDEQDECRTCNLTPCQCDAIYDRYSDR